MADQRAELERIINTYLDPFPFSPPADDDAARNQAPKLLAYIAMLHRNVLATVVCDPERVKELHLPRRHAAARGTARAARSCR